MTGRKVTVGLCMFCALLFSAVAASSASAITGTTAFTCVKGQGTLRGEHCLTTGTAPAEYGHVAIAENTTTEITSTNAKTESETTAASIIRLKWTFAGVVIELSATGASGSGWMENKKDESGEHYVHGEGTVTFTGVEVTKPAGKGCKVYTDKEDGSGLPAEEGEVGVVHTQKLTATTTGQGDNVKFQPAAGKVLADFIITCEIKVPALEGTWSVEGSVRGQPNGATVNFTHATVTAEETLFVKGVKVGLEGKFTFSGREKGSAGAYTPLSATTVTT